MHVDEVLAKRSYPSGGARRGAWVHAVTAPGAGNAGAHRQSPLHTASIAGVRRPVAAACSRAPRRQGHAVEGAAVYPRFEALARLHRGAVAGAAAPATAVADEAARTGEHAPCYRPLLGRALRAGSAACGALCRVPKCRVNCMRALEATTHGPNPGSARHAALCFEPHLLTRHSNRKHRLGTTE